MAILNNSNAISSGGYDINNSLRFRQSATAYLSRTPSASNRKTWTWSGWVKRGKLSYNFCVLFEASDGSGNNETIIQFTATNTLQITSYIGAYQLQLSTTPVFRDPSAWYHIVVAFDTTQATAANRCKVYVNGNQVTAFAVATYPSQNYDGYININQPHTVGYERTTSESFDGYMADVYFIDGSAKTPSDFGETDTTTGSWKPKAYTGTYGTNGFYLKFSDIATTSGSNAGLGKDFSGNANYWTTNNISVTSGTTYDAMIDSPTLTSATVANYAVMNPLGNAVGNAPATLSEANLTCKNTATSYLGALGTIGLPTSGKFYWEVQLTQNSGPSNLSTFGIAPSNVPLTGNQANYANSVQWYLGNNNIIQLPTTGTVTAVSGGATTSDVFQICYDGSTGKVYLGKNNTFYNSAGSATGNPSSGTNETTTLTTGDLLPWFFAYQEGAYFNFGQRPFSYTPPTGFVRLNTYNLPDSTIKKGNSYMEALLYTGNGTNNRTVTGVGFNPSLTWVKSRSLANSHVLADSVRGTNANLYSNLTNAETAPASSGGGGIGQVTTDGFTLVQGTSSFDNSNGNGATYVAWNWLAGTSSSSNTSGSITSTVSVNATAGFSVVTYTGTGANATVGHGLGVAPKMIICKNRTDVISWLIYHSSLGATKYLEFNTSAAVTATPAWNNTEPTSSLFTVGTYTNNNGSGKAIVAYCWAEIAGFSKFTSYVGNGSADGPFVYCGFRPKYVMYKDTANGSTNWEVVDSARNTTNPEFTRLFPNQSNADDNGVNPVMDFTANGFKIKTSAFGANNNGNTHIVMAFAESPFRNSLAR
jgi:hypothetical protein